MLVPVEPTVLADFVFFIRQITLCTYLTEQSKQHSILIPSAISLEVLKKFVGMLPKLVTEFADLDRMQSCLGRKAHKEVSCCIFC